jgi:chromosome segregation ATPase
VRSSTRSAPRRRLRHAQISALELTLDARVSELEQARANVTRLVSEEAELRAALATRDTELAALLAEMDNLRTDKVTQGALAEAQRVQIATLHATNAGLEASVAEHARAARDLDALVSAKSDDIARLSAAHADTMATLAALEERVQSLARSGAAAEAAAAEERAALEARLTDAVAGRDTLAAALSTADADKAALELARASLDSELAGTKQALAESEAEARQLAVSFSTTTASVEQLRAADADKETVLGEVRTTLAAVTAASVAQSNEVDRLRALVATSELSLDETCTRLHAARDALARRNADIVALEAEKQNLVCAVEHAAADQAQAREALATRDVKIASLADDLLASSGQLQDLRAVREVEQSKHCNALARAVDTAASRDRALEEERMAKAVADADLLAARVAETATRAELGEVRRALDAEKIVVADLQRNLATATACARDADDEIADLRAAKRSDEQTIDGLRRGYEDLRQAQLSAFSKLDSVSHSYSHACRALVLTSPSWRRLSHPRCPRREGARCCQLRCLLFESCCRPFLLFGPLMRHPFFTCLPSRCLMRSPLLIFPTLYPSESVPTDVDLLHVEPAHLFLHPLNCGRQL